MVTSQSISKCTIRRSDGFWSGGYYGSCWRWQFTPWGWQRIWVCGYGGYGYPLAYTYW